MPTSQLSIATLRDRALGLADRLRWLPALAMRTAVGVTFIGTGWGKLHHLDNLVTYFDTLGIPAAGVQAPMVATIELVGGALILAGLATRIAALLLTGVMAVAIYTAIWPAADGVVSLLGTVEVIYLASFLHLAANGAGAASLDRLITHPTLPSTPTLTTKTQGALV